jgi:DNA-binding CsgD family transcriptional regulator
LLGAGGSHKILLHVRFPRHQRGAERSMELLNTLRDDLLVSFEIASAFLDASNTVKSVIDCLDHEGVGVAVVSADGQIESANGSMSNLLLEARDLRVDQGRAHAIASTGPLLPDLVRRTVQRGGPGRLRYNDPRSLRSGNIVAYTAPPTLDWTIEGEGKMVLLVTDLSPKTVDLKESLRRKYDLTAAESRVAERLRDGRTSRQIATEFSIQTNCVRSHLKSIYAKTGTHSQVELLNFLQREKELIAFERYGMGQRLC